MAHGCLLPTRRCGVSWGEVISNESCLVAVGDEGASGAGRMMANGPERRGVIMQAKVQRANVSSSVQSVFFHMAWYFILQPA